MTVSLRFDTEQFKNFAKNMREALWGDYIWRPGSGGKRYRGGFLGVKWSAI